MNRLRELEELQKATDDEGNPIEFNEEEFYKNFDEKNPEIEIPTFVDYDVDDDFDLDK
jgi:hypothetical protein